MAQHYRNPQERGRYGYFGRGERGFEGDRSHSAGDYPEEFVYRRDYGREHGQEREQRRYAQDHGRGQQGGYGSRYGSDQSRRERWSGSGEYAQGSRYSRGGFSGERSQAYGDTDRNWDVGRGWGDQQRNGPQYYGTGRHYGGGFSTSAGTRAIETGLADATNYGRAGWSEEEGSDWLPESGGAGGGYGWQRAGHELGSQSFRSGQRTPRSFRGRGPRGYERSDERIKEIICERLTDDPAIDASDITIEVNQKVVKLTGTVDDRRTKYEVEELVEHLGGVKDIDNQLRVQSNQWRNEGQSGHGEGQFSGSLSGRGSEDRTGSGASGPTGTSSSTTRRS